MYAHLDTIQGKRRVLINGENISTPSIRSGAALALKGDLEITESVSSGSIAVVDGNVTVNEVSSGGIIIATGDVTVRSLATSGATILSKGKIFCPIAYTGVLLVSQEGTYVEQGAGAYIFSTSSKDASNSLELMNPQRPTAQPGRHIDFIWFETAWGTMMLKKPRHEIPSDEEQLKQKILSIKDLVGGLHNLAQSKPNLVFPAPNLTL